MAIDFLTLYSNFDKCCSFPEQSCSSRLLGRNPIVEPRSHLQPDL